MYVSYCKHASHPSQVVKRQHVFQHVFLSELATSRTLTVTVSVRLKPRCLHCTAIVDSCCCICNSSCDHAMAVGVLQATGTSCSACLRPSSLQIQRASGWSVAVRTTASIYGTSTRRRSVTFDQHLDVVFWFKITILLIMLLIDSRS